MAEEVGLARLALLMVVVVVAWLLLVLVVALVAMVMAVMEVRQAVVLRPTGAVTGYMAAAAAATAQVPLSVAPVVVPVGAVAAAEAVALPESAQVAHLPMEARAALDMRRPVAPEQRRVAGAAVWLPALVRLALVARVGVE